MPPAGQQGAPFAAGLEEGGRQPEYIVETDQPKRAGDYPCGWFELDERDRLPVEIRAETSRFVAAVRADEDPATGWAIYSRRDVADLLDIDHCGNWQKRARKAINALKGRGMVRVAVNWPESTPYREGVSLYSVSRASRRKS